MVVSLTKRVRPKLVISPRMERCEACHEFGLFNQSISQ
jgi:hypothetical protein